MRLAKLDAKLIGMRLGTAITTVDGKKLVNGETEITDRILNRLQNFGMNAIYIEDSNTDVTLKETLADVKRADILKKLNIVYDRISQGGTVDEYALGKLLRDDILPEVRTEPVSLPVGKIATGFELAQHSLNVCLLAVTTGIKYGLCMEKVEMLGKAALLHDIGKILKGNSDEAHEQKGYIYLKNNANSPTLYTLVRFHHETIDGEGPQKLPIQNQTELIKILSICDTYENLFSKDGLMINEFFERIQALVNVKFDEEVYVAFRKSVYLYPIGLPVKLNNGEEGIVVRQNDSLPPRPFVRTDKVEYNLMEHLSLFVDNIAL